MEEQKAAGVRWWLRPLSAMREAADNGDAAAQAVLGGCYHEGHKGLSKSPKLAAEWWTKAAAQGNAPSLFNLSLMSRLGDGVPRNKSEELRCCRLAAKQGDADAMFNLAKYLSEGEGCEKDPVLSVLWMRRSAVLGFTNAQGQLGHWYMEGEGSPLPVNYKEALQLLRLAVDKGDDTAFVNLNSFSRMALGCLVTATKRAGSTARLPRWATSPPSTTSAILPRRATRPRSPPWVSFTRAALGPLTRASDSVAAWKGSL